MTYTNWPAGASWPKTELVGFPKVPGYLGFPSGVADPLTLPGSASLKPQWRTDSGVVISTTANTTSSVMKLDATSAGGFGAGGAITLSGTPQAGIIPYIICHTGGALGTAGYDISLDGGLTFTAGNTNVTPPNSTPISIGGGVSFSVGAGTAVIGTIWNATVASWTDRNLGVALVQTTATKQPRIMLHPTLALPIIVADGVDDIMTCTSASASSWVSGNDLPFCVFMTVAYIATPVTAKAIFAAQGAANANVLWHCSLNTSKFATFKEDNTAGLTGTITSNPVVAAGTVYNLEFRHTGIAGDIFSSGTSIVTAPPVAQDVGTCSAIDTLSIFGDFRNSVGSAFGNAGIFEISCYAADVHATTATAYNAYTAVRYAAAPQQRLSATNFADRLTLPATLPVTCPPNDYDNERWRTLTLTGSGPLTIFAVACVDAPAPIEPFDNISIYSDGTYAALLDFVGEAYGYRRSRVYTPADNNTHTIEVRDYASVVGFSGNYTIVAPVTTPTNRVIWWGASRWMPFGVSVPSKGLPQQCMKALPASYRSSIHGVSGENSQSLISTAPLRAALIATLTPKFDGTGKNILVYENAFNDASAGVVSATIAGWFGSFADDLHTALPNVKIFFPGNWYSPDDLGLLTNGETVTTLDNAISAVAAARPAFVNFVDFKTICNNPHPGPDYFDAKHINDSGVAKMITPMNNGVLAW